MLQNSCAVYAVAPGIRFENGKRLSLLLLDRNKIQREGAFAGCSNCPSNIYIEIYIYISVAVRQVLVPP